MKNCHNCELHHNRSTVVIGDIAGSNLLCFIGEAPGREEDRIGRPFVGRSGKLLDKMLNSTGLDRTNVNVLNIVKCRPPNNRTPTSKEMTICGDTWLQPQLMEIKPTMIVTLGSVALRYFFPQAAMTASKGIPVYHERFETTLYPLFHPSYILRNGNKLIEGYKRDFELLLKLHNKKISELNLFPTKDEIEMNSPIARQKSLDDFF